MDDEEFLRGAGAYIDDDNIAAARSAVEGAPVFQACAEHGGRPKVVYAFLGRLKRAVVVGERVTSALDYADPFEEPCIYDPDDFEVCAAFAIFRTLERPHGRPMLVTRRALLH
ncbi:MAG: hypothetical protein WD795_17025 [Woeseia sp.]